MARTVRARVNGTTLTWREAGEGAALLLLHGFPFDSRLWEPQLAALPPGWRGIAPDLRGFGGSEAGGLPLTMEQHARDALALLDHLGVTRAVVCGLSMGGYCALALHRIEAGRVRALVLCDTRAEPDSDAARRQRAAQAAEVREHGSAELVPTLLRRLVTPATLNGGSEVAAKLERMMRETAAETLIEALHGLASRPDARPQLPGIRVPTLVLGGALDEITPPEVLRDLGAAIPGANLRLLAEAGHASNLEAADAFNAELHAFLAALGGSGDAASD